MCQAVFHSDNVFFCVEETHPSLKMRSPPRWNSVTVTQDPQLNTEMPEDRLREITDILVADPY